MLSQGLGVLGVQLPDHLAEAALHEDDAVHLPALADDLVLADVMLL